MTVNYLWEEMLSQVNLKQWICSLTPHIPGQAVPQHISARGTNDLNVDVSFVFCSGSEIVSNTGSKYIEKKSLKILNFGSWAIEKQYKSVIVELIFNVE